MRKGVTICTNPRCEKFGVDWFFLQATTGVCQYCSHRGHIEPEQRWVDGALGGVVAVVEMEFGFDGIRLAYASKLILADTSLAADPRVSVRTLHLKNPILAKAAEKRAIAVAGRELAAANHPGGLKIKEFTLDIDDPAFSGKLGRVFDALQANPFFATLQTSGQSRVLPRGDDA